MRSIYLKSWLLASKGVGDQINFISILQRGFSEVTKNCWIYANGYSYSYRHQGFQRKHFRHSLQIKDGCTSSNFNFKYE